MDDYVCFYMYIKDNRVIYFEHWGTMRVIVCIIEIRVFSVRRLSVCGVI